MSDPRSPLDRIWHTVLLMLAIVVSLWLILWVLAKIWVWLLVGLFLATAIVITSLWWRRRRDRW